MRAVARKLMLATVVDLLKIFAGIHGKVEIQGVSLCLAGYSARG